ncbi:urease accessory protein UreD [Methylobacterium iners]|uniref:Urease accessory protein UreD n=1 Tax=Methylobacterium iners TaxID=418707 RepID=A0ABQ4S2C8_9HYPH|nr:urease accessory protein UreD [Methylobacterium iners]GJD97281.1 Urease accessory protein UreD [Methylobacterium iners]
MAAPAAGHNGVNATADALLRQRSVGQIRLRAGRRGTSTSILDLSESGPLRLRLPRRTEGPCEAVLLNTAGGIACGDRFTVGAELEAGADLVLTSVAAEKIYRSDGPVTRVATGLTLGAGARLAFLPQETILFDGARLSRSFEAELAEDAQLLALELLVFGRAARAERIASGHVEDRWRIRRGGRLVYADTLRLDGPISDRLDRVAIGGGARAMATLVDASPEAEGRIEAMRALIEEMAGVEAGASAWNGNLVARFLGRDPDAVRRAALQVLVGYRAAPMPRVWQA